MDFQDIEKLVGFTLPGYYKAFIENYPSHFRILSHANGYRGDQMLVFDSLDEIYKANQIVHHPEYRYERLVGDDCEWCTWPRFHLVIGDSGCGDFYVLVSTSDEVTFWNHETGDFSETWPTLLNCMDSHYEFFHNEGVDIRE